MAGGQGAAGGGRAAPALIVAVHDLAQARAALAAAAELGIEIDLATAPGLAGFAGVGFCVALEQALDRPLWIDCADEPGTALAALRAGARRVLVAGAPAARGALVDIARQLGAELCVGPPAPRLVLAPGEDAPATVRAALAAALAARPSSTPGERL